MTMVALNMTIMDVASWLKKRKESGHLIIKPCAVADTNFRQFQPFNNPSEPLSSKKATDKDRILVDLVRYVITLGKNIDHE
jgi:hypothetical protein